MSTPDGPLRPVPAGVLTTRELKRLRNTFPWPTDRMLYLEMIRRGLFRQGIGYGLEMDMVESVAKEIIQRNKSDLHNRWNITPDLIEEAQRIVELIVRFRERPPEEAITTPKRREGPVVKRPPRALNPPGMQSLGSFGWAVRVPFRDPATGKALAHYKTIRGAKKNAQAYLEWYMSLVAAGEAPETVSQVELQDLAALERKAAKHREKLLARVDAGGRVEPGLLSLSR